MNKRSIILGLLVIITTLLTSCVSLYNTTISDISPVKGDAVSVTASGMGFLSLTVPAQSKLEQKALEELKEKGVTKNITSRLTMRNWVIVQYYRVKATGEK